MTEVVFAHEGTVAKIIGDAIDVLFGALDAHAERYRQEWEARGAPLGVTRIGVHAGLAIVGNFGGGRLYDNTAYGDTINTAARLEAVNKQLGTRICVSAAAAERAEGFVGRPVGDLLLRGRTEPMRVFEPLRPEERKAVVPWPMPTPSRSLRPAIQARSPPSPHWSANPQRTRLRSII